MDIFTPKEKSNGLALVDIASGAWHSDRGKIRDHDMAGMYKAACSKGFTVFAIRPGSVTRFTGAEMHAHVKRGIRWVRHHAADYGIDPDRIGLQGASAGGHLASLAALRPDPPNPQASDPVDQHGSSVQAVGVFFPPTDFVAWRGGTIAARTRLKGLFSTAEEAGKMTEDDFTQAMIAISPARFVSASAPPFLIFHGTADPLVPLEQSEILNNALTEAGVSSTLIIKEGGGHPWPTINEEVVKLVDWFGERLKP
jgi:acetyl esterase/lipase